MAVKKPVSSAEPGAGTKSRAATPSERLRQRRDELAHDPIFHGRVRRGLQQVQAGDVGTLEELEEHFRSD